MNNNDLVELVKEDKQHIINFLQAHNFKVKNNQVTLLFSDGEVDESKLDQLEFQNLWELEYEPSLVRVEFIIESPKELHSNIPGMLELLIDKITTRRWPVIPFDPIEYTKELDNCCPHFKSINFDKQYGNYIMKLIGAICYCN